MKPKFLPLPKKPIPPYIRPAMTIGAGFKYGGYGLVLCSDQQMTRRGVNKFFETKLFHNVTEDRVLVLVGADDLGLAKEVWDKLLTYAIDSTEAARTALEGILDAMGRSYSDLPVHLLLGVATREEVELFNFIGRGIHAAPVFSVIGIGDVSLVRYLADRLHSFFSTSKDAVIAASYILRRAEEYVDSCDGPIDLAILRPGPSIEIVDNDVIEKLDEDIKKQELSAFSSLLSTSLPFPIEP